MHIGVPLETHAGETRVAATPETIKKLVGQGHQVTVQAGAGISASIPDQSMIERQYMVRPSARLPRRTAVKNSSVPTESTGSRL